MQDLRFRHREKIKCIGFFEASMGIGSWASRFGFRLWVLAVVLGDPEGRFGIQTQGPC